MNLKGFFATRFIAIALIIAIAYFVIYNTSLVAHDYQRSSLLLVSGISTFSIMAFGYRQLKTAPTTEEKEIVRSEEEFKDSEELFGEVRRQHLGLSDTNPEKPLIKEVETKRFNATPPKPRKPSKADIEREIYLNLLLELALLKKLMK